MPPRDAPILWRAAVVAALVLLSVFANEAQAGCPATTPIPGYLSSTYTPSIILANDTQWLTCTLVTTDHGVAITFYPALFLSPHLADRIEIYEGTNTAGTLVLRSDDPSFSPAETYVLRDTPITIYLVKSPNTQRAVGVPLVFDIKPTDPFRPCPPTSIFAVSSTTVTSVTNWLTGVGGVMATTLPAAIGQYTPPNTVCTIILQHQGTPDQQIVVSVVTLSILMGYDDLTITDLNTGVVYESYHTTRFIQASQPIFGSLGGSLNVTFVTSSRPNNQYRGFVLDVVLSTPSQNAPSWCVNGHTETIVVPATGSINVTNTAPPGAANDILRAHIRYPPNTVCRLYASSASNFLRITSAAIHTELYSDPIEIYAGDAGGPIGDPLRIVSFHIGPGVPDLGDGINTTSRGLWFVFKTDNHTALDGWNFQFGWSFTIEQYTPSAVTITTPARCPFFTVLSPRTTLQSTCLHSSFQSGYAYGLDCRTLIRAPLYHSLTIVLVGTLGPADCVYVYDASSNTPSYDTVSASVADVGRLLYTTCGLTGTDLRTFGPRILIQLRTNGFNRPPSNISPGGFTIKYSATPSSPTPTCWGMNMSVPAPGNTVSNAFGVYGPAVSINRYAPNMKCSWRIDISLPVKLTFDQLGVQPGDSLLVVGDSASTYYDSAASRPDQRLVFTLEPVTVYFTSDSTPQSLNGPGFIAHYEIWYHSEAVNAGVTLPKFVYPNTYFVQKQFFVSDPIIVPVNWTVVWPPDVPGFKAVIDFLLDMPPGSYVTVYDFNNGLPLQTYTGYNGTYVSVDAMTTICGRLVFNAIIPAGSMLSLNNYVFTGIEVDLRGDQYFPGSPGAVCGGPVGTNFTGYFSINDPDSFALLPPNPFYGALVDVKANGTLLLPNLQIADTTTIFTVKTGVVVNISLPSVTIFGGSIENDYGDENSIAGAISSFNAPQMTFIRSLLLRTMPTSLTPPVNFTFPSLTSVVQILVNDAPGPGTTSQIMYLNFPNLQTIEKLEVHGPVILYAPRLKLVTDSICIASSIMTALSLPSLQSAGSLAIMMDNLATLDLSQLQSVEESLTINAPSSGLSSISLPLLTSTGSFQLGQMNSLTSLSLPRLAYAEGMSFKNLPLLAAISLPMFTSMDPTDNNAMVFQNTPLLQTISLPVLKIFASDANMINMDHLRTMDLSACVVCTVLIGPGNFQLQNLLLPSFAKGTLLIAGQNYALRNISLPSLDFASVDIESPDVTNVYAPSLRSAGILAVSGRMTSLAFPALQMAGYLLFELNNFLTTLTLPSLREIIVTMSVVDVGVAQLNLPRLAMVGPGQDPMLNPAALTISSNLALGRVDLCQLQTVLGTVSVDYNLQLPQLPMQILLAPYQSTVHDCNTETSLSFGCASSTAVVSTTDCGFSMACIQSQINNVTSGVIQLLIGTYVNCTTPLNFFGRPLELRGDTTTAATTTIDCQGAGSAFRFASGEGASTVVRGMVIRGARAATGGNGGAFVVDGASPSFVGVAFVNNAAPGGGGGAGYVRGGSPSFDRCTFTNNQADTGGALLFANGATPALMSGCTFFHNSAANEGGGLALMGAPAVAGHVLMVSGLNATRNTAARGGGVYAECSVQLMDGATLLGNTGTQYGGGLAVVTDAPAGLVVSLWNTTLVGNSARQGGGAFVYSADLDVRGALFSGNAAAVSGAGLATACSVTYKTLRGLSGPCPQSASVVDSKFLRNTVSAGSGGGFYAGDVTLTMTDSMFQQNAASVSGGGLYATQTALGLSRTTLQANTAQGTGGGLYCEASSPCVVSADSMVTSNSAGAAGGGMFICISGCPSVTPFYPSTTITLSGNQVGVGGYGAQAASDIFHLDWLVAPAPSVVSGFPLSPNADGALSLLIQDYYDQTVSATINVLVLTISGHTQSVGEEVPVFLEGTTTVLASGGRVVFDGPFPVARDASATGGLPYTVTCAHATIAGVAVSAPVSVLPCGDGQGVPGDAAGAGDGSNEQEAGEDASGLRCATCAAGTYANGGSNYTCLACQPGTFSSTVGSARCTPCPTDSFQSAPGATACLPCGDNAHTPALAADAAVGAVECVAGDQVNNIYTPLSGLSSETLGIIIGCVLGFFCLIAILVRFVYRYSRRKTMEKYYLDEDATVRRGVTDQALSLAVRKFITASSTSRIGGGEFTDIYKGKHENKWIALKVVKGEFVGHNVAQSEFRREVIALSTLKGHAHPAVVGLVFYLDRSPVCIGLEYCRAGSLKRVLASLKLSVNDKVRMAAQVASGLALIHNCNIAHMDMKTDNLLLSDDKKNLKVADFGICRMLGYAGDGTSDSSAASFSAGGGGGGASTNGMNSMGGAAGLTSNPAFATLAADTAIKDNGQMVSLGALDTQNAAFTPQYVDPYLLHNPKENDPVALKRADVFSFGMVLWALWAQEEPFVGVDATVLTERRTVQPDLRPALFDSCHRCYQSVMERTWGSTSALRPSMLQCVAELNWCLTNHFHAELPAAYLDVGAPLPTLGPASTATSSNDALSAYNSQLATGAPVGAGSGGGVGPGSAYNSQLATGGLPLSMGPGSAYHSQLATVAPYSSAPGGPGGGVPPTPDATANLVTLNSPAASALPPGGELFLQTERGGGAGSGYAGVNRASAYSAAGAGGGGNNARASLPPLADTSMLATTAGASPAASSPGLRTGGGGGGGDGEALFPTTMGR